MNELILLKKVQRKAKLLFTELYLNTVHEFKASKCWFTKMCRRNNLLHHRVTSAGQQIPKNGVEFEIEVLHDMKNIGEFENLKNMDKTPRDFLFNYWQKRTIGCQSQNHRCQKSWSPCCFNSRSKGFLIFASLCYWYLKIWRRLLQVNLPRECKFLVSRVEQWNNLWWKKAIWDVSGRKGQVGFLTQESPFY